MNPAKEYLNNNKNLPTKHWTCEWTSEMLNEIEKCNNDITHFAENYFYIINVDEGKKKIKLYDCQKRVIQSFVDNRFVSVVASRQVGKALDENTPIPTPDGFKRMGDLQVGDKVFDLNGNICNVIHAHDTLYNRDCYEVIFDSGESIITDGEHNWFTQDRNERRRKIRGSVKTTNEILNKIFIGKKTKEPNHRIELSGSVKYPYKRLVMSPYVLGVWLGDGYSNDSRISCGLQDKKELKQLILNEGINISDTDEENEYFNLIGKTKWNTICPIKTLRKLNVINNKHIPNSYLFSSVEQRKELLRGLMDTDGYVNKKGVCQFYSSNKTLHENVKQLLSSLGVKWSATSKFPKIKDKIYDEHFILTFKPEFYCFKLERKKNRQVLELKSIRNKFHYIKQINKVENRPVRCISVDSPDSLFLCGTGYIPTHNSTMLTIFSLWLASFNKDQNIFILANKEETAKMILERVRLAYEEMPNWIKPAIKEFTKTALVFENGSAIRTSTTSSQGIRGQSVNCLMLDEFAFIRPEIAHEFYEGVAPTISSSRKAKVIMTSTPNSTTGKFYDIYSKAERIGTKEWNGWIPERIMWDEIPRYNIKGELDFEGFKNDQIALLGGDYNSWLQEYCCVFLDNGATALNASVYEKMIKKCKLPTYIFDEGDYIVWEEPKPGHIYSIGVDTSEGVGLDYSVAQIMDITDLNDIRQVGQYHSNTIQPYVFAERLNRISRAWGRPFLCIERNGPGGQVIDALYEVHKYDNIVQYSMKNDTRGVYQKLGIYCHTNSKYTGIMNMKYWVEHLQSVTIYDINTMKEYETFRRKDNGSWTAQDGFYDDRIMSIVWSLIILETEIAQRYFNVLSYDDVGKPRIIKDPSGEFKDYLGIHLYDDNLSSLRDPAPSFLGVSPNDIFKSSGGNGFARMDLFENGKWSIL